MRTDSIRPSQNLMNDLNVFNVHMNTLFSIIHKKSENNCKSWTELFTHASTSSESKQDIKKAIASIGMELDDLKKLQKLRRLRNRFAHPHVPISVAKIIVGARWKDHESYDSLVKMLNIVKLNGDDDDEHVVQTGSP